MANKVHPRFFQQIDQHFGNIVTIQLKNYATHTRKLAHMNTRRQFLINCRKNGIFPTHITNTFRCVYELLEERSPYTNKLSNHIKRFKQSVLNIEIKHTFYKINKLNCELQNLKHQIIHKTNAQVAEMFIFSQELSYNRIFYQKQKQTNKKFQNLLAISTHVHAHIPTKNEKAILNTTKKEIPKEVAILLSLSPKFSLQQTSFPQQQLYHLLAETETILKTNPDTKIQDKTRCMITNSIHNFVNDYHNNMKDPEVKFLKIAQTAAKKFLQSNPDICVLPADKGNRTVIMSLEEYDLKMKALLSDTRTYTTTKTDPTNRFQTANNNIVKRLLDLKLIDSYTASKLKTYTATCPRIYGQPKAHKQDLPLRPVVPGMTSPSYNLSKYICRIYQMSIETKYNVTDSRSFCSYINNITIPPKHEMISLDVVSLFTNIPKELVIRDTINSWEMLKTNTNINLDLFLEIVTYCLDSSYFMFRNQYYLQLVGSAMGNPLSPILADLIMEPLIDNVLHNLSFPITVVKKYVDDLFLIIPTDKKEEVLAAFNAYHNNIQFTIETEQDGRLPYLDMTVVREPDNTLHTEWRMKSIASGRLLNYLSIHPLSQKINTACNFIARVTDLSTCQTEAEKHKIVMQQLRLNDYPRSLINRCYNRVKNKKPPSTDKTTLPAEHMYRSLPYIPKLTPQVIKLLKQQYHNVKITPRCINTVGNLFTRIKDPLPNTLKHNVIYKVPCNGCDRSYVGMTGNLLKSRLSGHQSNVNKLEQLLGSGLTYSDRAVQELREKTALICHCIDEQHRFNLAATTILDSTYKKSALSILEMVWIYNDPSTVNKRKDVDALSTTFAGILHAIKKHPARNKKHTANNI